MAVPTTGFGLVAVELVIACTDYWLLAQATLDKGCSWYWIGGQQVVARHW